MQRYELLARGNDSTAVDVRPLDGDKNRFGKQTLGQLSAGEIIVKYNDVRIVLTEKDREIARLKEWQRVMFGAPNEEIRHAQQMEELQEKHQALMEQAVRFAQFIFTTNNIYSQNPVYKEAQAFLKEHP